jgi:hypothetical protein
LENVDRKPIVERKQGRWAGMFVVYSHYYQDNSYR